MSSAEMPNDASYWQDAALKAEEKLARIDTLLEDLERSYPDPAPYDIAGTVIDRLRAVLDPDNG